MYEEFLRIKVLKKYYPSFHTFRSSCYSAGTNTQLERHPSLLIEKINFRSKEMVENGAIKEVKNFLKLKVRKDKSVNKAIGINEIRQYLNNKMELEEIIENISIKTRQYAKRQSTWARGNMNSWFKLKPNELNNFLKKI